MRVLDNCFSKITDSTNLWHAWLKYRRGKRSRPEVLEFEKNLENNLVALKEELENGTYKHGGYKAFLVHDPKSRLISSPSVKDHLVHQAVYSVLYPFFDRLFSPFSFSCRIDRGTQKAVFQLEKYLRQVSCNYTKECWVLHGDVEKCFDSIRQDMLFEHLKKRIHCPQTLDVLKKIISSYESGLRYPEDNLAAKRGIPLGNLTSQLFVNIYLNSLDKFIKEEMRVKKYFRYADDFLIVSAKRMECVEISEKIRDFLWSKLLLQYPESHQKINKLTSGVETLGIRFLFGYRKVRPSTSRRIQKLFEKRCREYKEHKIDSATMDSSWRSMCGMLTYTCDYQLKKRLLNIANFYAKKTNTTA
ncbi:MAG: reverse transcriptase/maturase family protein [Patescibacteria group bacterium]|nr:reverse transcriptase/maturase family protein [Patescibacteria group bacterium]MBU2508834.1 reverse transcriptase/maturase family protein [Patescibacteria group bacterium]